VLNKLIRLSGELWWPMIDSVMPYSLFMHDRTRGISDTIPESLVAPAQLTVRHEQWTRLMHNRCWLTVWVQCSSTERICQVCFSQRSTVFVLVVSG